MEQVLFDSDFFNKLNTVKLNINMRLNKGTSGSRKSSTKGSSLEFSDFREYILGDDLRHIDWNAYGRTDKLLIKLFMEEKEGRFHIFMDGSKSMDFGEYKKAVCGCQIAAALSYVVLNNLDRVFLTTVKKEGVYTSAGLTGRQSFPHLLKQLEDSVFESDLEMDKIVKSKKLYAKGVTILISDFYMMEDFEQMIRYLAYKKQEIIVIQTLSREELQPEMEGTLNLIDSETGRGMKVTMNSAILRDYQKTLKEFTDRIESVCRKYGAVYVLAPSDQSIDQLFFEAFGQNGILHR